MSDFEVPVRANREITFLVDADVAGGNLGNSLEKRPLAGDVTRGEEIADGLHVHRPPHSGLEDRLDLGAEEKLPLVEGIVQGLLPDPIPGEKKPSPAFVPERNREHPLEKIDEIGTVILVEMDDRLRVAVRRESMTGSLEGLPEILEIVDLPVENHPDVPLLVGNRLGPRLKVDHRQSPHGQSDTVSRMETVFVRPAVNDDVAHLPQQGRVV